MPEVHRIKDRAQQDTVTKYVVTYKSYLTVCDLLHATAMRTSVHSFKTGQHWHLTFPVYLQSAKVTASFAEPAS